MAYLRELVEDGRTETILCVANVSRFAQAVELELGQFETCVPVEMLGGAAFPPIGQLPYLLTLPPYGFYWFVLAPLSRMPPWFVPAPQPLPEFVTLVVRNSLQELLADPIRSVLEREVLPAYLPKRRWFAGKDQTLETARIAHVAEVPGIEPPVLLAEIEVPLSRGSDRYLLPFGFISEEAIAGALPQQLALARVRRGRRVGFLTDAFALDSFARRMVELLAGRCARGARRRRWRTAVQSDRAVEALQLGPDAAVRRPSAEQSNSALIVGGQIMLKLFRRIHAGAHPEAEMGRYLTEHGYPNIASMLGEITRRDAERRVIHARRRTELHLQRRRCLELDAESARARRAGSAGHAPGRAVAGAERIDRALPAGRRHARSSPRRDARGAGPTHRSVLRLRPGAAMPPPARIGQPRRARNSSRPTRCWTHAVNSATRSVWPSRCCAQRASARCICLLSWRRPESVRWRLACTGICTWGRRWSRRAMWSSSTSRVSRRVRSSERRALSSPLRDVAGMLRSFDYAAATITAAGGAGQDESALLRKRSIVERFRQSSGKAFLAAYQEASAPHRSRMGQSAEPTRSAEPVSARESGLRDLLRGCDIDRHC